MKPDYSRESSSARNKIIKQIYGICEFNVIDGEPH